MLTNELLGRWLSWESLRGFVVLILALRRLARSVIFASCFSLSAMALRRIFYRANSPESITLLLEGNLVNV